MADLVQCLYCGDTERPKTSEHVLQKGMGGNLTLPNDVCTDCNTRVFAPLDKHLVDVVRGHLCWRHPAVPLVTPIVLRGHTLVLGEQGAWESYRLAQGKMEPWPQLIFMTNKHAMVVFGGSPVHAEWNETFRRELAVPETLRLKHLIVKQPTRTPSPPVQPALLRSGRSTYAIRALTVDVALRLEEQVRRGGLLNGALRGDWGSTEGVREGESQSAIDLGPPARALAKTALNFVCSAYGRDIARCAEFDGLRRHALYGEGEMDDFVQWCFGQPEDGEPDDGDFLRPFIKAGRHSLIATNTNEEPMVSVALYGKPIAHVFLSGTKRSTLISPLEVAAGYFDYEKREHVLIRLDREPLAFHHHLLGA